jgi:hypothetical protein
MECYRRLAVRCPSSEMKIVAEGTPFGPRVRAVKTSCVGRIQRDMMNMLRWTTASDKTSVQCAEIICRIRCDYE